MSFKRPTQIKWVILKNYYISGLVHFILGPDTELLCSDFNPNSIPEMFAGPGVKYTIM